MLVVPVLSSTWRDRLFGHDNDYSWKDYYYDSQQSDQTAVTEQEAKGGQCEISHVYTASLPVGKTEVDYFNGYMDGEHAGSIEECAAECCRLGREVCQYAWIFTDKCVVVGCTEENAWKCIPISNPKLSSSVYASVSYSVEQVEAVGKTNHHM